MQPRNFYYGKDADVVAGSANFASLIATGFASYGLTSAQSTAFGLLNTALQSAYATAINPSTRSPVAIENKTISLHNMRVSAINLAKIIYSTATVNDAQLVALGLLPRTVRTPRPVPGTPPTVELISVAGRVAKIRVHDTTSERRGLPFGATSANIYSFVGAEPPTDPREYYYEGATTRAITEIMFPNSVPGGVPIWISAQWVSARGQRSVGSTPISITLPGGAIPASAS